MANIWKRSLSMLLTLVMVFGMLPLSVFADDDVTPPDETPEEIHEHSYTYACSTVCATCGEGAREASHTYVDGKCACGEADPDYVAPSCEHSYTYACSTVCATCGEGTREASHTYVNGKCACGEADPDYVAPSCEHSYTYACSTVCATCGKGAREASHTYVDGKCECGEADPDYVAPSCEHSYTYACSTVCATCGEGTREASHTYVDGKCECGADDPDYIAPHECVYVEGKCETCGAAEPVITEEPEATEVEVSDLAGLLDALESDSTLPIVVTGQIEVEEDTILNLNGKTVSGTHADKYSMIHVQNGAELTINGEGTITYAPGGNNTGAAIWVEGALIQNGGTIEVTGEWSFGFAVDLRPNAWGTAHTEPASFVMNDGKIKTTDTAVRVASNSSDDYEELGVSFTMQDGEIESEWDAVFVQHLYVSDLDVEIIDGTISGTNSVLRIYGDSGSDIAMNIKGGSFDGVVKVADAYVDAKPITITGGTFSADVSAYVVEGYVQNADGGITAAPVKPEVPIVIPANIVDTIVGENATEEQKAAVQAVVDEIAANTALTDESYNPVEHIEGVEKLAVTLSGMVKEGAAAPDRITFTIEPKNADGEKVSEPSAPITFRLPVPASVPHSHAKVFHGNDLMDTFEIKGSGNGKYIEVSSAKFSEFTAEFVTPVAEVELPEVTITDIKPTLTADDPDLTFALNFAIKDLENIQNDQEYLEKLFDAYGHYYTDYVLTISGLSQERVTFNANGNADGYLAGQYDAYGTNWLSVPFEDVTVENGSSLYIMAYAAELLHQSGLRFTLEEVAELVQNFDCGVYFTPEFLTANPDMVITLELKVFTEDAAGNIIDDHRVAVNEFKVEDIAAIVTGEDRQTGYHTSVAAALADAEAGDTVKLLRDVTENYLTVTADVTLDLNGHLLTAGYFSCFGDIVDNDAAKGGTLKVEKSKLLIQKGNAMLPVNTAEGYKFVAVTDIATGYFEDTKKFAFVPKFNSSEDKEPIAHELLAEGLTVTGVTFNVKISWKQEEGVRSQSFVYTDAMLKSHFEMYKPNEGDYGKYGKMFTLVLKNAGNLEDLTFTAMVVSDTGVIVETEGVQPENKPAEDETGNVTKDENNQVAEQVTITNDDQTSAVVPEGTKLEEDATNLTLTVTAVDESQSNITLGKNEAQKSVDVHIEGVAADNTVPMTITLPAFAETGLNEGNIHIYHVENGETVEMTRVAAVADFTAHNQYWYDPVTGDVVLYMATFSEVAVVSDTVNAWNGKFDYSWYTNAVAPAAVGETDYVIANADQLAAFGAIVGGMNGQTQDAFAGKTVKLLADIDLGDAEKKNDPNKIFYPIGYYNSTGNYEKVSGDSVTSSVSSFEGTFDGNGHTIKNFYQNTWEMFGDYNSGYSGTPNHYDDAMGLFGYVVNGTVKNLTVENFSSDGEFTPTGVIAAYAVNSTFENIALVNCNPRVYNTGNGGIVGIGGNSDDPDTYKLTFNNITIDNTNKITALWGSWDVACGGLVGMFRGAGHVHMTNCHVAAQIDVYNDVCGNYQYYWYRYSGMMVGTNKNMITDKDGYTVPETSKFHAENCTVHFGDWNDYYYCELVANSLASYTHDHQFSRLQKVDVLPETATGTAHYYVKNDDGTITCRHFINGARHEHNDSGEEDVNGTTVLKEDKTCVYLPFNQLFTGYGWGVKHIPIYDDGTPNPFAGVTILGREVADSEVKFDKADTAKDSYTTGTTVTIGELFKAATLEDEKLSIKEDKVQVTVSPVGEGSTAGGTYTANTTDWAQGTLTFSGTGAATITITDYYFCTPTTISLTIDEQQNVVKFEKLFTGDFLYRVGNQNAVKLGSLFEAKDGAEIGTVEVTVEPVEGSQASGTHTSDATWTNGTIQFSGTGVVKVTITDNDYCTPAELILEVVDAKNATTAASATANNVVLLNDIGSGFTVSGRYTVYGNGFTLNYTDNGQYLNNGLKQGVVTVSENGTLDNLRIVAPIYPKAYLYYGSTLLGDYVQGGPSDGNNRYYYQLSAVAASGNATISNCYIYGGRNNIFINTGDVTITDTILECGTVANVQIQSNASYTITFNNVTTLQKQVNATVGETGNVMLGAGILVGPDTAANPTIVLSGSFKQYNWVTADDASKVSDTKVTKAIIESAVNATAYNHNINGQTASNLGIIYLNEYAVDVSEYSNYVLSTIEITMLGNSAAGQVYSPQNAPAESIYSDNDKAERATENGLYEPQFKYAADLGGQYIAKTDDGDEFCYREGDTIEVMFPSGDTKELDLAGMVNITKYTGQDLALAVTAKDEKGNTVAVTDGKVSLSTAGEYTVTYTVIDTLYFGKDGSVVNTAGRAVTFETREYSWDVMLSVSLKDKAVPDAYFEFVADNQKMGYYKPFMGDVKQYLPFLAGLKIYDYNGQTSYLRFDGDKDFNKVASIEVTDKYSGNDTRVVVKLTDGGVIETKFLARADSGGGSDYTGSIKTSGNTIYYVNNGGTSNKDTTTTAAYWYVDYYKFTGNNGVAIQSGQQTFNSSGSSASTPSGSFSTTIKYTVTYDANEGNCGQTVGYATSASATVTLPTPTRSGYMFVGWYTAASGGTRVGGAGESYTPGANITLYAQWGKPSTVIYNANGGTVTPASEKYTGTALTLPTPTRDGYWFTGWYDAAEGGTKVGNAGASYQATGDVTLYAQWSPVYTVTYNANGGSVTPASAKYEGTALTLPMPTRDGYAFNGWYTAASGGTKVEGPYTPTENITLYAQWKDPITITYDAATNGGSCSTTSQTYLGTELTLPTPADRTGYTFNGWYTAASGGTKVESPYIPSANITLYAQWQINSYTIKVTTSNATVKVNGTTVNNNGTVSIQYGAQVTVEVTYSETDSQSTTIKGTDGTTYTSPFEMPAQNVTINATSSSPSSCVTPDTLITLADGSQVRVDSLTGDEELLVWNMAEGKLDSAPILFLDSEPEEAFEIIHLYFSDGTDVKVIYEHGFWDYDLNKYVYLDRYADKYIGHTFAKQNGEELAKVQLTDVVIETEVTTAWSPVTAGHLCYFVNGMLSMPGGVGGLFNIFDVDPETMTYDPVAMQQDIETYGLFTYAEMNEIVPLPEEMFEAAGGAYLKVSIGKGNMTVEDLIYMVNRYSKFFN